MTNDYLNLYAKRMDELAAIHGYAHPRAHTISTVFVAHLAQLLRKSDVFDWLFVSEPL